MFFSLSDYNDLLDHTYFFVCYWIYLFFQSKLFFKWWYTHAGLIMSFGLQHTLLCILCSMTIILIFQNEPHLPSPVFRTNGFCSQVVEGRGVESSGCRWGDPPERCAWVSGMCPGPRVVGRLFLSHLWGGEQHGALGGMFSQTLYKACEQNEVFCFLIFAGLRGCIVIAWWLPSHSCLVFAFALCFDGGLQWRDVTQVKLCVGWKTRAAPVHTYYCPVNRLTDHVLQQGPGLLLHVQKCTNFLAYQVVVISATPVKWPGQLCFKTHLSILFFQDTVFEFALNMITQRESSL